MAQIVSVTFSGPALAFLLYENVKSTQEQEGFLLGDTNVVVKKIITDSVGQNVKLEKRITVNAVIPCPQNCLFYDNIGRVNTTKLKEILGGQENTVVAWFKYRRNANFKLTVREKIIHKELMKHFAIEPDLFSVCLLSSSTSNSMSTHTYAHKLMRYFNRQFQIIPIRIDNLGEPYSTYKSPVNCSRSFLQLYESLELRKDKINDLNIIADIQKAVKKATSNIIINNLQKSERKLSQLQEEVEQLRKQIEVARISKDLTEPIILDNGIVEDDISVPYYIVVAKECCQLSDDVKSEENKEIISLDSNSDQSLSPSSNVVNETPLIDLTLTDEEDIFDTPSSTHKVPTYAQVMSSPKPKRNNT